MTFFPTSVRPNRAFAFACLALTLPLNAADSWRDYRGPSQDGHAGTAGLPMKWSET